LASLLEKKSHSNKAHRERVYLYWLADSRLANLIITLAADRGREKKKNGPVPLRGEEVLARAKKGIFHSPETARGAQKSLHWRRRTGRFATERRGPGFRLGRGTNRASQNHAVILP